MGDRGNEGPSFHVRLSFLLMDADGLRLALTRLHGHEG